LHAPRDYGKLLESKGERPVTVRRCETVEEVLRVADVVSLHCNLDADTRHLINAERLAVMKPDAVLVNAARGPCIDEAALVAHLKANPDFRAGERLRQHNRIVVVVVKGLEHGFLPRYQPHHHHRLSFQAWMCLRMSRP
jgi:hypothetical protein